MEALYTALHSLKLHNDNTDSKNILSLNVTLLSNFSGIEEADTIESDICPIISAFKSLNAQLIVL